MAEHEKKKMKVESLEVTELEDSDLDDVAGGLVDGPNTNCPCPNTNCPCPGPVLPQIE